MCAQRFKLLSSCALLILFIGLNGCGGGGANAAKQSDEKAVELVKNFITAYKSADTDWFMQNMVVLDQKSGVTGFRALLDFEAKALLTSRSSPMAQWSSFITPKSVLRSEAYLPTWKQSLATEMNEGQINSFVEFTLASFEESERKRLEEASLVILEVEHDGESTLIAAIVTSDHSIMMPLPGYVFATYPGLDLCGANNEAC